MLRGFTAHTRRSVAFSIKSVGPHRVSTAADTLQPINAMVGLVLAGPQRYLRSQHPLSWSTVCTAPLTAWNLDRALRALCALWRLTVAIETKAVTIAAHNRLRYCRCEARLPAHTCCCGCGSAAKRSLLPCIYYIDRAYLDVHVTLCLLCQVILPKKKRCKSRAHPKRSATMPIGCRPPTLPIHFTHFAPSGLLIAWRF
jgi:hypothetical protein